MCYPSQCLGSGFEVAWPGSRSPVRLQTQVLHCLKAHCPPSSEVAFLLASPLWLLAGGLSSSKNCSNILMTWYLAFPRLGLPWWLRWFRICVGSIPWSGRSPGEGNGNPLKYFCLENFMHRKAWQALVHGVPKSQTRLSD